MRPISPGHPDDSPTQVAHWALACLFVLALHGLAAWAALFTLPPDLDDTPSGALTIELAPVAVARADLPAETPNGPDQVRSEAVPETPPAPKETKDDAPREETVVKKEETPELVKVQEPDALPSPEPEKKLEPEKPTPPPTAPSVAVPTTSAVQVESPQKGPRAVAVQKGITGRQSSNAVPTWARRLSEMLERNKRYPKGAQTRREQGIVQIAFTIDRSGKLLVARVAASSGSTELDQEALDLLGRSAPFPPPPVEMPGDRLDLVVPLHFKLK